MRVVPGPTRSAAVQVAQGVDLAGRAVLAAVPREGKVRKAPRDSAGAVEPEAVVLAAKVAVADLAAVRAAPVAVPVDSAGKGLAADLHQGS